jgi:hypothetical protein
MSAAALEIADGERQHRLRVAFHGRAFPGGLAPYDGDWLAAEIAWSAAPPLRFAAFLRCRDLARFERDLGALLLGRAARASFWPADPWLTLEVHPVPSAPPSHAPGDAPPGRYAMALSARDPALTNRGAHMTLDLEREAVEHLLVQLAAVTSAYPVGGRAAEP